MIRMVWVDTRNGEGGLFCPHIFCDHCGELIEAAGQGLIGWFPSWPEQTAPATRPMDLHMLHRRCSRAFEAQHWAERGRMYWDALTTLPTHLAANLPGGLPVERIA